MTQPGLVVAIVTSGIFGAALLWLGTYYLHKYIHWRCLELDHWFHWHVKREDFGREKASNDSRSPPRRGRSPQYLDKGGSSPEARHSRSGRRQRSPKEGSIERRRAGIFHDSTRIRLKDRPKESLTESTRESPKQRPKAGSVERMERRWERPPAAGYYPPPGQAYQHQIEEPTWQQQMAFHMAPQVAMPMPYPLFAPAGLPVVFPATYNPGREQQHSEPYEQELGQCASGKDTEADEPSLRLEPRIIDFIMECDELPPILRKVPQSPQNSYEEVSGDEIDGVDDDDIQQVPRAYIPRSVPHAAISSYPQATAVPQPSFWNTVPARVPERRTRKARYAPYVKAIGQGRRSRNADRRRLAPTFETYKPSPRRRRPNCDRPPHVAPREPIRLEHSHPEVEVDERHNEGPRMEQEEARGVEAVAQEIEEKKEEDSVHVDAGEPEPEPEPEPELEAPPTEVPVYLEQDLEPQQYVGTEDQAPEAAIKVEMIEDENLLERQPTILVMATNVPAKEAAPPVQLLLRGVDSL